MPNLCLMCGVVNPPTTKLKLKHRYACVILGAVAVVAFVHAIVKQQVAFNQPYNMHAGSTEDELDFLGLADSVERGCGDGGGGGGGGLSEYASKQHCGSGRGMSMMSPPGTSSKCKDTLTADERRLNARRLMEQFSSGVSRFKLFR